MRVSFLIPAHNEEGFIGRAVGSVRESAQACGMADCEIVVCNNASTDATASVATAAGARVVHETHRQIARARNEAAAASSGDWLVWLDADAILTEAVLRATLSALGSGKICGGGARVQLEGAALDWVACRTVDSWNWIARTFGLAAGSYFFALREGWAETGGFNERVYAGEELGFARALKRWGRRRGQRFHMLDHAVPSSARKVGRFTTWQLARQMALIAWPGSRRRRDRCAFWYERVEGRGTS